MLETRSSNGEKMKTVLFTLLLVIIFSCVVQAEAVNIQTIYTDLAATKCKTIESTADEGGSYRGECPGVGGYKLEVLEGDLRQTINVIAPDGSKSELELWSNVSGAFSTVGAKAEWRVEKNGKKIKPVALIVRYNTNEDPENIDKQTSRLVVIKIIENSACITDIVEPMPDANAKARKLADASAGKPCKFGGSKEVVENDDLVSSIESYANTVREFINNAGKPHLIMADVADYNDAEQPEWKRFDSEEEFEKARESEESYETAYIWKKNGKVVAVNFTYSSPSGDWVQYVYYIFREDGSVATVERDLRTFMDDIIVDRGYVYDQSGKILKETRSFRDLNTGDPKDEPEDFIDLDVEIYKTTRDLPFASLMSSDSNGNMASGNTEESFVPGGWKLEGKATGDLNGDALPDSALQVVLEDPVDVDDRKLIILFRNRSGGFTKAVEAENILICTVCGGAKGGPADLEIKDGVLLISQMSGSRAFTTFLHRFRYEQSSGRFMLIGEDLTEHDGMGASVSTSTNYLNGKQIITKTRYDEQTEKEVVVSSQRKNVPKTKKYIEDVEI